MSSYNKIKKQVSEVLLEYPSDYHDEISDIYQVIYDWETSEPRDFTDLCDDEEIDLPDGYNNTRIIGSNNLLYCIEVLNEICFPIIEEIEESTGNKIKNKVKRASLTEVFNNILKDLESDNIIRIKPEVVREDKVKLIVNNLNMKEKT